MIYIVEDDPSILKLVDYSLSSQGYKTKAFLDPLVFEKELKEDCELIILDLMMPNKDGLSLLKDLRSKPAFRDVPIILLTAKTDEIDKVMGLDLGADDYIGKPFGVMELIARVKALLRRSQKYQNNTINYRDIIIDKDRHEVKIGEEIIVLTKKEYDLLVLLISRPGYCFSRDDILDKIWGYEAEGTRTVDVHIRGLRVKLKDKGKYIETVHAVGYRFN